jgi:hypothetical protein
MTMPERKDGVISVHVVMPALHDIMCAVSVPAVAPPMATIKELVNALTPLATKILPIWFVPLAKAAGIVTAAFQVVPVTSAPCKNPVNVPDV